MFLIGKATEKKSQFKNQRNVLNKMDNEKIIEKPKQSLSFIEQLQNQIQLCREALSDSKLPLSSRVQALETLLWAKIRDDIEYRKTMEKLNNLFIQNTKNLEASGYLTSDVMKKISCQRLRSKEQFKAIMIFIDKKNLMPYGEENE